MGEYIDLNDFVCELVCEGYICDENGNDLELSGSEREHIEWRMQACVDEEIEQYADFDDALDAYKRFLNCAEINARDYSSELTRQLYETFRWQLSTVQDIFHEEDFGDNLLWTCENEDLIPACLKSSWDRYKEEHESDYETEEEEA